MNRGCGLWYSLFASERGAAEAEVKSVLYELSADANENIDVQALSQALFTYVIKVMAERLSFASPVIGVFKRWLNGRREGRCRAGGSIRFPQLHPRHLQ